MRGSLSLARVLAKLGALERVGARAGVDDAAVLGDEVLVGALVGVAEAQHVPRLVRRRRLEVVTLVAGEVDALVEDEREDDKEDDEHVAGGREGGEVVEDGGAAGGAASGRAGGAAAATEPS